MKLLIERGANIRTDAKPAVRPPGFGGGSHGVGIVRSGVPPQGEQQPTPGGMTPLKVALTNDQLDVAQLLVEKGADVRAADWWGRTPSRMTKRVCH